MQSLKRPTQQFRIRTLKKQEEDVEPLSNYNVMVLDQHFHKNSSISFINTNVKQVFVMQMFLHYLGFKHNKNTYNLSGSFKYSFINELEDKKSGYFLRFSETSGKYRFSLGSEIVSKNYDNNDRN
jgi:hypothetical protein